MHDHVVRGGLARGGHHGVTIGRAPEARDILGDGALEQRHALGQVTDIAAEHVRVILVEGGAIEPDLARGRTPDPDQARASVDLPDPEGPMTPSA